MSNLAEGYGLEQGTNHPQSTPIEHRASKDYFKLNI